MNCNCFLFSFCAILFSVLYFSFYPHLSTHRLHVRLLPDLIYCVACAPRQPRKGPGVRLLPLPYPVAPLGRCRSPVSPSLPVARLSLNWDCMCGNEATWHVILWSSQRTLATANTHIPTSPLTQPLSIARQATATAAQPLQGIPAGQTPVLISIKSCN